MKYNGTDLSPELEQALLTHVSRPPLNPTLSAISEKIDKKDRKDEILFGLAIAAASALIAFFLLNYLR